MTREEAKRILQNSRKELIDYKGVNNSSAEALYVAIKSLDAWDAVQKEIYRQIDALDEIHEFRDKKAYYKALDIVNKYLKEVEHDKE